MEEYVFDMMMTHKVGILVIEQEKKFASKTWEKSARTLEAKH